MKDLQQDECEEEISKLQGDNQELRDILNGKDAIIASLSGKADKVGD